MGHTNRTSARAHNAAPTNDEAHGTPHAAGPSIQQTRTHSRADDIVCKSFATLRARMALAGCTLSRSEADDGPVTFYATRWGLVHELRDLDAVEDFAKRVGAES